MQRGVRVSGLRPKCGLAGLLSENAGQPGGEYQSDGQAGVDTEVSVAQKMGRKSHWRQMVLNRAWEETIPLAVVCELPVNLLAVGIS